jgi:hypothetical protein
VVGSKVANKLCLFNYNDLLLLTDSRISVANESKRIGIVQLAAKSASLAGGLTYNTQE